MKYSSFFSNKIDGLFILLRLETELRAGLWGVDETQIKQSNQTSIQTSLPHQTRIYHIWKYFYIFYFGYSFIL